MTMTDTATAPVTARPATGPTVDFILEGAITAVDPIHVSSPDYQKRPDQQGVTVIPTMRSGQLVMLPGVKGETLKGNIRAHATRLAIDIMRARTGSAVMPFGLNDFYRLDIGGVKGSDKQKPEDIVLLTQTRVRNPIVAIFGGAEPYWAPGLVEFGHAVADDESAAGEIVGGARFDKMLRDPSLLAEFSEEDQQGWLSYSDVNSAMSKVKKDIKQLEDELKKKRRDRTETGLAEAAALKARIDEMKAEVKQTKSEEMVGETITRPLPSKNAILPGAVLTQKMRGNRLSVAQFGFFLKTLELLSDRPRIGGHTGRGFGTFSAEWRMRARINSGIGRAPWQDLGAVTLRETEFTIPDHDIVRQAMVAFEDMAKDPAVDFGYAS